MNPKQSVLASIDRCRHKFLYEFVEFDLRENTGYLYSINLALCDHCCIYLFNNTLSNWTSELFKNVNDPTHRMIDVVILFEPGWFINTIIDVLWVSAMLLRSVAVESKLNISAYFFKCLFLKNPGTANRLVADILRKPVCL
jgi:hypothetical protein